MPDGPPRVDSATADARSTSLRPPDGIVWPSDLYRAPLWVVDSTAQRCGDCRSSFSVWRRRHHCRLCGGVFCSGCANKVSPRKWRTSAGRFTFRKLCLCARTSQSFWVQNGDASEPAAAPLRACSKCFTSTFSTPLLSPSAQLLAARPTVNDPELAKLPPTLRARSPRGTAKIAKGTWRSRLVAPIAQMQSEADARASSSGTAVGGRRGRAEVVRRLRNLLER